MLHPCFMWHMVILTYFNSEFEIASQSCHTIIAISFSIITYEEEQGDKVC